MDQATLRIEPKTDGGILICYLTKES